MLTSVCCLLCVAWSCVLFAVYLVDVTCVSCFVWWWLFVLLRLLFVGCRLFVWCLLFGVVLTNDCCDLIAV